MRDELLDAFYRLCWNLELLLRRERGLRQFLFVLRRTVAELT